jgi:hypothetical protein
VGNFSFSMAVGQPVVPPGAYTIEVEVKSGLRAAKEKRVRVTDVATGLCHQFAELRYDNNAGERTSSFPPSRSDGWNAEGQDEDQRGRRDREIAES